MTTNCVTSVYGDADHDAGRDADESLANIIERITQKTADKTIQNDAVESQKFNETHSNTDNHNSSDAQSKKTRSLTMLQREKWKPTQ